MEIKELRTKSKKELTEILQNLRAKLRDLRFKVAAKQLKNIREVRAVKKQIAQILTVLQEIKTKK